MQRLPHGVVEVWRDVISRRNRPWLLVAIGFCLVLAAWKYQLGAPRPVRREPDTIEYHYGQWLHQKANATWGNPPRFTVSNMIGRNMIWLFDGKPTVGDRFAAIERHEVSLIRLGYFEERRFDWPGGDFGNFMVVFTTRARATDANLHWSVHLMQYPDTNVVFTARTQDMPAVEALFKESLRAFTNTVSAHMFNSR